jgi:hypothetical protein
MRTYCYELHYTNQGHHELNTLLAESLEIAIEFFDNFYLTLHRQGTPLPECLVLRLEPEGTELLRYDTHQDVVSTD